MIINIPQVRKVCWLTQIRTGNTSLSEMRDNLFHYEPIYIHQPTELYFNLKVGQTGIEPVPTDFQSAAMTSSATAPI